MPYMPKVMPAVAVTALRNSRMANIGSRTKAAASRRASILMNRMRASAASTNATPAAAGL